MIEVQTLIPLFYICEFLIIYYFIYLQKKIVKVFIVKYCLEAQGRFQV
jgi:hypothetical protein